MLLIRLGYQFLILLVANLKNNKGMKKTYILLSAMLLAGFFAHSQAVERNVVVLEIATGTWCTYCPGAAKAADQLISEGKSVAVIENHNGDSYATTASNARNSYYSISGYPTGYFDGSVKYEGGAACPSGNVYSSYLPLYNQRIAVPSPITVCFAGTHTGNDYTITVRVTKLASYTGNDVRLHLVLTESAIPVNWQGCMTDVNFVNRLMVPDQNGTSVSFAGGDSQTFTLNFTKQSAWNAANCELVAFVQDNATKEIFNGAKCALNTVPATLFALNDFSASVTQGCIPLTTNFTTAQNPGTTYTWTFNGGSPSSSTAANPTVSYNYSGVFDVVLSGTDGVCFDTKTKVNYISTFAQPASPNAPVGESYLCLNPPNQNYSVLVVPNANAYLWQLTPANAGVLTPNANSCTIDWDNAFEGVAMLQVQATNNCGNSPWSLALPIHIDATPGQCAVPTGPTLICQDQGTTSYTVPPINPATNYEWVLTPSSAGTFFQGSNTIDIVWDASFAGTATLVAIAHNNACQGPPSNPLSIQVQAHPTAHAVTGGGTYCGPSGAGMPVGLAGSQTGVQYQLQLNGVNVGSPVAGTGNALNFGNQLSAGAYTVNGMNTAGCITTMSGNASVQVDPSVPAAPTTPAGPAQVFTVQAGSSDYVTTGANYATSYTWDLSPASAGNISSNGLTATATWNSIYSGTAQVKVQGTNTCGSGSFSQTIQTQVNVNVGNPEPGHSLGYYLTPMPATGTVTLHATQTREFEVKVFSTEGKCMLAFTHLHGELNQLNITSLKAGTYSVLIITKDSGTQLLKLIVQ